MTNSHHNQFHIVAYNENKHAQSVADSMASGFSHDHWPLWQKASPRFVYDLVRLMGKVSNLNFVVEEKETGKAYGQIFCMAPASARNILLAVPLLLKMLIFIPLNLYFFKNTAWKHIFAVAKGLGPLMLKAPHSSPHFEVFLFVMHEKLQGKGYGNKLMDAAIKEIKNLGAEKVTLLTDSTMSWQFYERYGYKRIIEMDVGAAYKIAMNSDQEYGYIYELDFKEKLL
jgi:ribosomal protein S18 acetylase RimI-like enzyme